MRRIAVVCAGSHATVLIEAIRLCGAGKVVCAIDDDPTKRGATIMGVPVLGSLPEISELRRRHRFDDVVIGMANYSRRSEQRQVFRRLVEQGFRALTVVHPTAFVSPSAHVGSGVFVGPGAVLHACVRIGDNVVVNTGSTIAHDAELGEHVFVSPGVTMAGHVAGGAGAYIGPGASVGSRIRIGADAVVGGGACVLADVAPGMHVFGIPARPKA